MNLRKVLHLLNRELAPYLTTSRRDIALNRAAPMWLDVAEFETAVRGSRDTNRLQAAMELYRGDFLDGFHLPDCHGFEDWASARRTELNRLSLQALAQLAQNHLAQGNYQRAEQYARRQLEMDNLRERGHRQLMEALACRGQRSEALAQYESCRHILAAELGVQPAPATTKLAEEIRNNQLGSIASDVANMPIRHKVRLSHLPLKTTPIIGREVEMERLGDLLADPTTRLVTITGPGGIGKSRLALAMAERESKQFAHGIFFVALAPVGSGQEQPLTNIQELIAASIANAVGYHFHQDRRNPRQQILDFLQEKALCLVLDNFEHLIDGANLLSAILQAAPRVKLLVTSREPLGLYREQVFPVTGLEFSAESVSEEDPAVQLFLQRARQLRPDFALREGDRKYLTAICRLVEGMPLALELAAARVDLLSLADIAAELRQSLDLLEAKWPDAPSRHRNMRATFDASWRRLTDEEREIFCSLSVFQDRFTRRAARVVCAREMSPTDFRRVLAPLVQKSLLFYDTTSDRYNVHELLRQYGAEKLADSPELEADLHNRHSDYFCTLLHENTETWHTDRQAETLQQVKQAAPNIRQAWHWALAHEEWTRLARAIDSWRWYHRRRLRIGEFEDVCRAIVKRTERAATGETAVSPDSLRLRAKALTWLSWSARDERAGLRLAQDALDLLRVERSGQDVRLEKALALQQRALRLAQMGNLPAAKEDYRQSLTLFLDVGWQWGVARSHVGLAVVDWRTGNCYAALHRLQKTLTIQQKVGDRRMEAQTKHELGLVYRTLGQLDEAARLQRAALDLGRHAGDLMAMTRYKTNLARTLLWLGNLGEAHQLAVEGFTLAQDLDYPLYEARTRAYLAEILLHAGSYRQARGHAERARLILHQHESTLRLPDGGSLHLTLAELALVEGAYVHAEAELGRCRESLEQSWDTLSGIFVLAELGFTTHCLGKTIGAGNCLAEALTEALALQSYQGLVLALPFVARLLAAMDEEERANEIWELARKQPFVAHSTWFNDVVGRELDALRAASPSEKAQAGGAPGQAAQLWESAAELLPILEASVNSLWSSDE